MNDNIFPNTEEQAAAFQKIWTETMAKTMQAAFMMNSGSPPPEIMHQVRSGIFQALGESWDQFMRSPQFLEGMRQCMENAVAFRKLSNDFLAKARNEMQAPARDDVDSIMLNVRHMEKRLLDRVDELSAQIKDLQEQLANKPTRKKVVAGAKQKSPSTTQTRTPGNGQTKSL